MNKKEKIIKLKRSGYSYKEIVKQLHISKQDITKFSKNIKLSKKGRKRYLRKVKGIIKPIKKQNNKLTLAKTRIIGHLLFDGSLSKSKEYHYQLMYINASNKLVEQFCEDIKKVYGLNSSIYKEEGDTDLYRLKCLSKLAYGDLIGYTPSYSTSNKSALVPNGIIKGGKRIQLIFLRTFWDDEGSISRNGILQGCLKSDIVINQLANLHTKLGFKIKIYVDRSKKEPSYILRISKTKDNLDKFYKYRLFTNSIATKGYFKGMKKIDILKNAYRNFYKT